MNNPKRHHREHRGRKGKSSTGYAEHARAEAITIAWTISAIATALAMVLSVAGLTIAPDASAESQPPSLLTVLTPLMLFTAAVTGLVAICLTPLVYFSRRVPPPLVITVLVVGIAVSPLVLLVLFAAR